MKITAIIENTAGDRDLFCEHGLSLFIETDKHRILFDFGETGRFADNAESLGVPVAKADIAVLSHGHYDHGGGMARFFEINESAPVYVQRLAFEPHYAAAGGGGGLESIGLDPRLPVGGRVVYTDALCVINDGLTLFSDVTGDELLCETNKLLLEQTEKGPAPDRFLHEQNLLISEKGKLVLITGCAHRGIVNILERAIEIAGRVPDAVVGGFHLSNPGRSEGGFHIPVEETARRLLQYPSQYYTCHCTGLPSYEKLKGVLGDKIGYLSGGAAIEIGA